ncbi:hypothetical protein Tco_1543562, partial [Tanacetum coccineum]
ISSRTPLPSLKNLQGAYPSSELMTLTYQDHSPRERYGMDTMKHTKPETKESSNKNVSGPVTIFDTELVTSSVPTEVKTNYQESKIDELTKLPESSKILYYMKCKKEDHVTSYHDMRNPSLRSSQNYKAHPYQYASPSKQILKSKAKPFPSCTHCSFNDHHSDDCKNYPECEICRSYDHFTLGHNRVIQRNMREPIWYLNNGCSRSMTSVKSYLHKYVEQPGPKVVFGDNSSCITEGYGSINYGGIIFSNVAFVNNLKYNLISVSQLCDAKYIVQFDDKQETIFNANKEIVLIAPRRKRRITNP